MARADERRARYQYFRGLGYSSKDSARLRDQSQARTSAAVTSDYQRLRSIPTRQRTPDENERLDRLSRAQDAPTFRPRESDADREQRRLREFRRWSGRAGFPPEVHQRIVNINIDAGFDPNSSYGFRVFYHRYVKDRDPVEAALRAEKQDT